VSEAAAGPVCPDHLPDRSRGRQAAVQDDRQLRKLELVESTPTSTEGLILVHEPAGCSAAVIVSLLNGPRRSGSRQSHRLQARAPTSKGVAQQEAPTSADGVHPFSLVIPAQPRSTPAYDDDRPLDL
jgi:hypothetical protein